MRTELALVALLLVACSGDGEEGSVEPMDVTATVSAKIGTVVTVTWTTEAAASGYVEFGVDGAFDRSTEADAPSTEHTATLVGLPPLADVSLRVVSEGVEGETLSVSTEALQDVPTLTVEGTGSGLYLAVPFLGDTTRAGLVDPEGRVVWIYQDTTDLAVYRTHLALDGSGIIYTASLKGGEPTEGSAFVKVSWDGETVEQISVPWLAHDFVELPDGTLVSLAYETRDGVQGNKLVAVAPDGTVSDLWSAWDCFDPTTHPSVDPDHGWTHTNALDYDEASDAFLVGMRNLGTIASVDRTTGACNWALGGTGGDVAIDGQTFLHQHQFTTIDGGILVFDNDGAPGNESRVLEYDLDPVAGTASVARTIKADPPLYSFILGDVHRLAGGDTLVVWSVASTVDVIRPDESRSWRLTIDDEGVIFGFSEPLSDPGRPWLGYPR